MLSSLNPIDSAWSHLKNDDGIEKAIPLGVFAAKYGIPALFSLIGAYTGAGGRFTDDEGNVDLNFGGNAVLQDPATAGLIAEKELGDSGLERAGGALVGATQGFNPAAYIGTAGKGIKAFRAGRQAKIARAAKQAGDDAANAALRAGGNAAEVKQARILAEEAVLYPGVRNVQMAPGVVDSSMPLTGLVSGGVKRTTGRAVDATGRGFRRFGASRLGRGLGRGAQLTGQFQQRLIDERGDDGSPNPFAPFAGLALTQAPHAAVNTGGFGAFGEGGGAFGAGNVGGQASSFGQGQGIQDLANVDSNLSARREIFDPHGDYSTTRGQTLAARGMGQEGQFAGLGTKKGDNMKIGEQLLKEVNERIHKAHCGTELKADKKKADKKPAHGMVIVIGSKAGPGPSSNGKRDKLDSEKKKD
jgi:hypothetical protein|tara:strand:+ start:568 stop:1812 length:1245 start_codon:yes stop_codon:yes gene_type:complete